MKKVKVEGLNREVDLRKKILRPLRKTVRAQAAKVRPGDPADEKGLKQTTNLIKKLAADGTISTEDIEQIRQATASGQFTRGNHYEPLLRSSGLDSIITNTGYDQQVNSSIGAFQSFGRQQTGIIGNALQQSIARITDQLKTISQDSRGVLSGFRKSVNEGLRQVRSDLGKQRQEFAAGNKQSRQNIERSQSQIANLPQPPQKTEQIGTDFERVSAGDPLEPISQNREAVRVQSTPALTGFSTEQRESRSRQMQGLSGFRGKRQ
jgi:hypothetical protein